MNLIRIRFYLFCSYRYLPVFFLKRVLVLNSNTIYYSFSLLLYYSITHDYLFSKKKTSTTALITTLPIINFLRKIAIWLESFTSHCMIREGVGHVVLEFEIGESCSRINSVVITRAQLNWFSHGGGAYWDDAPGLAVTAHLKWFL